MADFQCFCASERRLAPTTCAAYERDVSACLDYLQGQGIALADVKVTHLRAFLAEEQKRRPAVASQARTTAALKCFFRFLVEEERLLRDPSLPLRTPKKRESLPDVLFTPTQPARFPSLRRCRRRKRAQARHAAHAPSRVRFGAPARGREPAPDPGPARPQAPRLHAALHARERPRAARRHQASPLGGLKGPYLPTMMRTLGVDLASGRARDSGRGVSAMRLVMGNLSQREA